MFIIDRFERHEVSISSFINKVKLNEQAISLPWAPGLFGPTLSRLLPLQANINKRLYIEQIEPVRRKGRRWQSYTDYVSGD